MSKQLTHEAAQAVMNNTALFSAVCDELSIKPVSLPQLVNRKSERLALHTVVEIIARHTGMQPDQILQDSKVVTA